MTGRTVRAKVQGRENSKEKCQEVRIAAVNKDTPLCGHGNPSRTTHPEANDYLGTESPQTVVFPASYPPGVLTVGVILSADHSI